MNLQNELNKIKILQPIEIKEGEGLAALPLFVI